MDEVGPEQAQHLRALSRETGAEWRGNQYSSGIIEIPKVSDVKEAGSIIGYQFVVQGEFCRLEEIVRTQPADPIAGGFRQASIEPVSYTHLTLPTILLV